MAIETPPPLTPAPTPVIQRGDRATFSNRVDAFISWLVPSVPQFAALASNVAHNGADASSSAVSSAAAAVSTAADRVQTGADRVQTGLDRASAAASAATIGTAAAFSDANHIVKNSVDASKRVRISAANVSGGTERLWTAQDRSGTVAFVDDSHLLLLASVTPTAANFIDFSTLFTGAFDHYTVIISGITPTSNGDTLTLRAFNAGVISDSNVYSISVDNTNGNPNTASSLYVSGAVPTIATTSMAGLNVRLDILNTNDSARPKAVFMSMLYMNHVNQLVNLSYKGFYTGGAVSGIRLYWSSGGNFTAAGRIRIYGYKNS